MASARPQVLRGDKLRRAVGWPRLGRRKRREQAGMAMIAKNGAVIANMPAKYRRLEFINTFQTARRDSFGMSRSTPQPEVRGSSDGISGDQASVKGGGRWKDEGRTGESGVRPRYRNARGDRRLSAEMISMRSNGTSAIKAEASAERPWGTSRSRRARPMAKTAIQSQQRF